MKKNGGHRIVVREYLAVPGKDGFAGTVAADYRLKDSSVSVSVHEPDMFWVNMGLSAAIDCGDIRVEGTVTSFSWDGERPRRRSYDYTFTVTDSRKPSWKSYLKNEDPECLTPYCYRTTLLIDGREWTRKYIESHLAEFRAAMENLRTDIVLEGIDDA